MMNVNYLHLAKNIDLSKLHYNCWFNEDKVSGSN